MHPFSCDSESFFIGWLWDPNPVRTNAGGLERLDGPVPSSRGEKPKPWGGHVRVALGGPGGRAGVCGMPSGGTLLAI